MVILCLEGICSQHFYPFCLSMIMPSMWIPRVIRMDMNLARNRILMVVNVHVKPMHILTIFFQNPHPIVWHAFSKALGPNKFHTVKLTTFLVHKCDVAIVHFSHRGGKISCLIQPWMQRHYHCAHSFLKVQILNILEPWKWEFWTETWTWSGPWNS
jgi:hypothetical protein